MILIAWLLSGCTSDPTAMSESEPPLSTQEVVSHVVPIEQALEELQSVLDVIDSPSENDVVTRSGGVRCVKDVATVSSDILPVSTRSGETNDVENLFYIVNFEEENGYAILGADNRLESVYAIVDEGSLTPEELQQAVTISDGEAEANGELTFPLKMVVQAAATGIGGPIGGIGVRDPFDPNKPAPTLIRVEKAPIVYDYHLPRQIPITLHQGYPCNAMCPVKNGTHCLAGCTAIAIAQLLIANYYCHGSVVGSIQGVPIDWSKIDKVIANPKLISRKTEEDPSQVSEEAWEVAKLVREIGSLMHLDYGTKSSSGLNSRIQGVLEYVLYRGVHDWEYQFSKVRQMLWERERATIVCGSNTVGTKKKHAFNLDGWLERNWTETSYYSDGGVYVKDTGDRLIHCNFGWSGKANGYYHYGAFDLRKGPVFKDEEERKDPVSTTSDVYYDMDLIITYTYCP